jgi:hypothetical protein
MDKTISFPACNTSLHFTFIHPSPPLPIAKKVVNKRGERRFEVVELVKK